MNDSLKDMWNHMYQTDDGSWEKPDEWFVEAVGGTVPETALEFGAGSGTNAIWLAQQGSEVTAIDYAPAGVELLKKRSAAAGVPMRAKVADITDYTTNQRFDLVYMCYMHLPETACKAMLENAARFLKPGGRLIYVGMTDVPDLPDGVEQAWFAPAETIMERLPASLQVKAHFSKPKTVWYSPDMSADVIGVFVEACKNIQKQR